MSAARHCWGDPVRFAHKTERECRNGCGTVKVTRHEWDGTRPLHWVEFWRDGEQIDSIRTPPCEVST